MGWGIRFSNVPRFRFCAKVDEWMLAGDDTCGGRSTADGDHGGDGAGSDGGDDLAKESGQQLRHDRCGANGQQEGARVSPETKNGAERRRRKFTGDEDDDDHGPASMHSAS